MLCTTPPYNVLYIQNGYVVNFSCKLILVLNNLFLVKWWRKNTDHASACTVMDCISTFALGVGLNYLYTGLLESCYRIGPHADDSCYDDRFSSFVAIRALSHGSWTSFSHAIFHSPMQCPSNVECMCIACMLLYCEHHSLGIWSRQTFPVSISTSTVYSWSIQWDAKTFHQSRSDLISLYYWCILLADQRNGKKWVHRFEHFRKDL